MKARDSRIFVTRREAATEGETRSQRHRRRQRDEEDAARAALAGLATDGQLDSLADDPEELEVLRRFIGRKGKT
jgi:hypothetical protein